jgi:hypothetical protein
MNEPAQAAETNRIECASSEGPPKPPPPAPDYVLDRIERKLAARLRAGLAQAGIETGPRRHRMILFRLNYQMGAWIQSYATDARWWRITFGPCTPCSYPEVYVQSELTFHRDEVTEQTGVDLARLLREPDWRWPIFHHDPHYPHYAWTELAHSTYHADWKLREARKAWVKRRQEERRAGQ